MAFKEVLPDYLAKVYGGLSKDELKEFGVKKKDDKFVKRGASFDGDSFGDFVNRAEDQRVFYNKNGQASSYDERFGQYDKVLGKKADPNLKFRDAGAAGLLDVFDSAGVPREEIPALARDADISNFNRPEEATKMLQAYLNKHTSQRELDNALSDFSPPESDDDDRNDRPFVREDITSNDDLPPISDRVIAAQERLDNPLIPLYEGQDQLRDDPQYAADYRDHFITQNFLGENGIQPNRMLGLYNAMNALA